MKKQEFFEKLQEQLETEIKITETTSFDSIPGYDSMSVLILIAFTDENFGTKLTVQQLDKVNMVKEYMDLIGYKKFE